MDSLRQKGIEYQKMAIKQKKTRKLNDTENVLLETLQGLDSNYENLIIVVEGKKDVSVLRNLDVKAPIIKTQTKLPRYRMAEQIAAKAGKGGQVLILTDFDPEGREICKYIERELELTGVKILKNVRRDVRRLMGTWRCIEDIASLLKRRDSSELSL